MSTPVTPVPAPQQAPPPAPPSRTAGLMGPVVLITLGVLFLGGQLNWGYTFLDLWPVLLIVIGVVKIIQAVEWNRRISA